MIASGSDIGELDAPTPDVPTDEEAAADSAESVETAPPPEAAADASDETASA